MKYLTCSLVIFPVIALMSNLSAAHAGPLVASSVTTIGSVSFKLVDLDTKDGVNPWIKFNAQNTASAWIRSSDNEDFFTYADGFSDFEAAPVGTYSKSLASPDGYTTSKFELDLQEATMSASASKMVENRKIFNTTGITSKAESTYVSSNSMSYETGSSDPFTGQYSGFTLSPKTAIIFSGTIHFSKSADFESIKNHVYSQVDGWSEANFRGSFSSEVYFDISEITNGELSFVDELAISDEHSFDFGAADLTKTTDSKNTSSVFNIRLDNVSKENKEAVFFLSINDSMTLKSSAYKTTDAIVLPPPAIPEPSTYALMLLGLAGLGAVARRQRRIVATH